MLPHSAKRKQFLGATTQFLPILPMDTTTILSSLTSAEQEVLASAVDIAAKCRYCTNMTMPTIQEACRALAKNYVFCMAIKKSEHCTDCKKKLTVMEKEKNRLLTLDKAFSDTRERNLCHTCLEGVKTPSRQWQDIKSWDDDE